MKALSRFLGSTKIGLIDIGARGGLEPRWRSIQENINAFLFEPDERSRNEIEKQPYIESVFPFALGSSEGSGLLNLCKSPGVSSLLQPNYKFLSRFPDASRFDIVKSETLEISTLDKCLKERWKECDFIKIDTQGTELDILIGGKELLESPIIGFEIEVEFIELYEEQNLFGDVCEFLNNSGYEFYDFVNICRWERDSFSLFGQAVFGDGFFLQSPEAFADKISKLPQEIANDKAKKYIAIASLYDHIDLLPVCLNSFKDYFEKNEKDEILKIYSSLKKKRAFVSFILRMINRLLRPIGMRALTLQNS